ncbi:MAG: hypothetical protein R2727_00145 [Bacteroidales bacterium]
MRVCPFIGVPYDRKFRIDENITVRFTHTGHMSGSAVANLGDKGRGPHYRIAYTVISAGHTTGYHPPKPFPQADYLITGGHIRKTGFTTIISMQKKSFSLLSKKHALRKEESL